VGSGQTLPNVRCWTWISPLTLGPLGPCPRPYFGNVPTLAGPLPYIYVYVWLQQVYTYVQCSARIRIYVQRACEQERRGRGVARIFFFLSLSLSLALSCLWSATLRGDRLAPSAAALPAHFVGVMVVCKCRKVSKWFRVAPLCSLLYVMVVGAAKAARSDVMGVFMMADFWFVSCFPCPRSPDPGASSFHSVSESVIRKWQPLPVVVVVVVVGCRCFLSSPTLCGFVQHVFSVYILNTISYCCFQAWVCATPPSDLGFVRCMAFWVQSLFLRNLGADED
jgi:hypothetical protein